MSLDEFHVRHASVDHDDQRHPKHSVGYVDQFAHGHLDAFGPPTLFGSMDVVYRFLTHVIVHKCNDNIVCLVRRNVASDEQRGGIKRATVPRNRGWYKSLAPHHDKVHVLLRVHVAETLAPNRQHLFTRGIE